jgi:hypothetical protein
MTEVIYEPRKQVIIHEFSRFDTIESLVRGSFGGAPPGSNVGPLKWVNGIVLLNSPLPITDAVTKELIEGRLHWDHVSFAPLEEFLPNYHIPDVRITVSIIDVSVNPTFQDIGKFIRENLIQEK